jgi:hypothetical protein
MSGLVIVLPEPSVPAYRMLGGRDACDVAARSSRTGRPDPWTVSITGPNAVPTRSVATGMSAASWSTGRCWALAPRAQRIGDCAESQSARWVYAGRATCTGAIAAASSLHALVEVTLR